MNNIILKLVCCISVLLLVVSCASSPSVKRYKITNSSDSKLYASVVDVVKDKVATANTMYASTGYRDYSKAYFERIASTPYGSAQVVAPSMSGKLRRSADQTINIDLKVHTVNKIRYGLGEYLIDPINGDLDPNTTVFVETVAQIASRLHSSIQNSGYSLTVHALYTGGADATGFRKPIPYSSPLGSISETVMVNGTEKLVSIKNNSYIETNTQLGLVRAKAVSMAVNQRIAPITMKDKFQVELSDRSGSDYRFVSVQLQLKKK